ncbi:MAG: hypothetical protein RLZZ387_1770 [Chloroflexota bacterium]
MSDTHLNGRADAEGGIENDGYGAISAEAQEVGGEEAHDNGAQAFVALGRFLNDDGWFPQPVEDSHCYRMSYNGESGELRCYALVRVDLEQFIFYAVAGVKVPADRRPEVAEFITRANYGLRIGNFELSFEDGEVRYKSSIDFEDETLTNSLIRNVIYPAVRIMDEYLPGLLRVAFGGLSADDAISEIEG